MPSSVERYWTAWNARDLAAVPELLADAVTLDVEWNDPQDSFVGRSELERAIRRLRTRKPECRFVIASELDHHHGRYRYRWDMLQRGRVLMEGLDIVTLDPDSALIVRVDGFFGEPTPMTDGGSSNVSSDLQLQPPRSR